MSKYIISVSMDPPDKKGNLNAHVILKGDAICLATMLTALVKRMAEVNPTALELHAHMLTDLDFITEERDD